VERDLLIACAARKGSHRARESCPR
jgi:hypothetical protein